MKNQENQTILMIDDEKSTLQLIRLILQDAGYRVLTAKSAEEGISLFRENPVDAVITDLHLPGMSGEELIPQVRALEPTVPVLVLTAYGTIESAVEMIKKGAYDYLKKPFEKDDLLIRVKKAIEHGEMTRTIQSLQERLEGESGKGGAFLGESPHALEIRRQVATVAPSGYPVLISGESGTGKELVAHALHRLSGRTGKLVVVNCGAIPENLFENEFFGHVKGAFTGARDEKKGLVEEAAHGTLFLDELGEIRPSQQAKILRFLQDKEFTKVGATKPQQVDVRLVAATNRNLKDMVTEGTFREDLFYRVNVIPIQIAPLRERPEDILLLVGTFLVRECKHLGKKFNGLDRGATAKLMAYSWPGNVRELENRVKWTATMFSGGRVRAEDIYLEGVDSDAEAGPQTFRQAKDAFERNFLMRLLRKHQGNISAAAREADKYRAEFYAMMKKHDLEANNFRS